MKKFEDTLPIRRSRWEYIAIAGLILGICALFFELTRIAHYTGVLKYELAREEMGIGIQLEMPTK